MPTNDEPPTIPSQSGSADDWQAVFSREADRMDREWEERQHSGEQPQQ